MWRNSEHKFQFIIARLCLSLKPSCLRKKASPYNNRRPVHASSWSLSQWRKANKSINLSSKRFPTVVSPLGNARERNSTIESNCDRHKFSAIHSKFFHETMQAICKDSMLGTCKCLNCEALPTPFAHYGHLQN